MTEIDTSIFCNDRILVESKYNQKNSYLEIKDLMLVVSQELSLLNKYRNSDIFFTLDKDIKIDIKNRLDILLTTIESISQLQNFIKDTFENLNISVTDILLREALENYQCIKQLKEIVSETNNSNVSIYIGRNGFTCTINYLEKTSFDYNLKEVVRETINILLKNRGENKNFKYGNKYYLIKDKHGRK